MKLVFKKGISIGIFIAAVLLAICYSLIGIGSGPCNASGIGLFYSFFIIMAPLAVAVLLITNPSPLISLAAKTVSIIILLAMFSFFAAIKYI